MLRHLVPFISSMRQLRFIWDIQIWTSSREWKGRRQLIIIVDKICLTPLTRRWTCFLSHTMHLNCCSISFLKQFSSVLLWMKAILYLIWCLLKFLRWFGIKKYMQRSNEIFFKMTINNLCNVCTLIKIAANNWYWKKNPFRSYNCYCLRRSKTTFINWSDGMK